MRSFRLAAALLLPALVACGEQGAEPPTDGGAGDGGPPDAGAETCEPEPLPEPLRCNGAAALCDRRYDEVSYPTTHNAMSNEADRFTAPNQRSSVPTQLADGIRGLMLDTHYWDGVPYLCHGTCYAGKKPLVEGLAEIRRFLDCHPAEVVTIIFESYISAEDTRAAFDESGLLPYVHDQAPGDEWPTLRDLVDADERLVVFTDDGGGEWPGYLDVWAHAFETKFSYETPDDLDCSPNRGDPTNPLFILNHFLTKPLAAPEYADMINHDPLLLDRARQCREETGHLPNFVTVDFYEIGDLFEAVDALNGL